MREPQALSPALRTRRAITLLVISLLVPGSAQTAAGDRRIGRVLLRIWLGLVAVGVLLAALFMIDRTIVISLFTSPFVLTVLALLLFVLAVIWPLAIGDAWRLGRPGLLAAKPRLAVSALAVVAMLGTSLPLIETGRRVWAGADLISGVFGSGTRSTATDGRFNVLLLGGDAGASRIGTRPDSMTLASVDEKTGRSVLFSLPRNLENIPFAPGSAAAKAMPGGWSCGDKCLLNGIYTWGSEHRSLFPGERDPGAAAMKQAIEGVTGLKVNYYVLIDLRGFSDLVDAMGGIRITVNQRVPIGGGTSRVSGYIEPGPQHLDGYHALWYARSRHGASDYARMARQRCVMNAMVQQMDPATVLRNFQGIAAAGKNVVSTDIPAGELATFIDLAGRAKSQKISSVQFVPPLINPARPDMTLIRSKVDSAIKASQKGPQPATKPSGAPSGASSGAASGTSSGVPAATASPAVESGDVGAECSAA
jgi:LCP family protein required for cell wall assembly